MPGLRKKGGDRICPVNALGVLRCLFMVDLVAAIMNRDPVFMNFGVSLLLSLAMAKFNWFFTDESSSMRGLSV